jgi:hypothetical protein
VHTIATINMYEYKCIYMYIICGRVANCVGLRNYKYFLQFVFYAFLSCFIECSFLIYRMMTKVYIYTCILFSSFIKYLCSGSASPVRVCLFSCNYYYVQPIFLLFLFLFNMLFFFFFFRTSMYHIDHNKMTDFSFIHFRWIFFFFFFETVPRRY